MRITIVMLYIFLLPFISYAQNPNAPAVDPNVMIMLLEELDQCMAKVDQRKLFKLDQEAQNLYYELMMLCQKGHKDKAQEQAVAFRTKMMEDPATVQIKACRAIMERVMPEGALGLSVSEELFSSPDGYVCDY